jgi:hypothetical protein
MKTGLLGAVAAAVVAAGVGAAVAQDSMKTGCVQRVEPHDWTLSVYVNVREYQERDVHTNMPKGEAFDFTSAAVIFPLIGETASSVPKPPPDSGGVLKLNDVPGDTEPQVLNDYPYGTKLGKWTLTNWVGQDVLLEVKIKATCYQTRYDEAAAMKLGWPAQWTGVAQSCLTVPQAFVELMPGEDPKHVADFNKDVTDLVNKWTGGKDPKSVPPAQLAKILCGEVLRHVQINGNGLNYARTGEVEGLALQSANETAKRGRGSEMDMIGLLAAVYRQAGLPARTVIGWDVGESKRDKSQFLGKRGSGNLRGWVEFALSDPNVPGGITWVPVDVVMLRKSSSRPPPVDRPWKWFGTNEDLDGVIPFSFTFHPPTTVVAHGSPAFWGWLVTPKPPDRVIQAVRFDAITTPKTAEDQKKEQEKKKDEKKSKNPYRR